MLRNTLLPALLATLAWLASAPTPAHATPGEVPVGQVLREARLQGLNSPPRALSAYRGKPLIINVWASWCGPCRQEMASLERLAWREDLGPFAVIGISTDDERDKALAFLKQSNASFNHYLDRQLEMEHMLGATRLPLTVLVDAKGKVLAKVYGAQAWDGAEALALIRRSFGVKQP